MSTEPRGAGSCPMPAQQIIGTYFLEHRARLLDLAAFLDRVDRAVDAPAGVDDFRLAAMREAIGVLTDGKPDRARRMQELLSDPTEAPIPEAATKAACGAWPGRSPD